MGELESSRVESNGMDTTADVDVTGDVMDEISALLERDVAENSALIVENDVETEDDDDDEL
jgi:hypothetical protein